MAEQICPHCGRPVPETALGGICPECMLQVGMASHTEAGPHGTKIISPTAKPEEIAPLFPQLEILECLGHGGMGAVYKARQPKLNRFVALKILGREKEDDPKFAERFTREAQALARLNHPNIVTVYDFGEVDRHCFLLMEFVDGLSLRQLMRDRKLKPEEALKIVPSICEALQFAHEQGIVHRDIKPENILLDKSGRVKIADFGIAKILGEDAGRSNLTAEQQVIGTPHYMAPEQVERPRTVDHRADIFSLGVVFYEMLTGELPLGKFQPPSRKVQVDVRLDEVVLHALEKEPDRRYQHASEVKTDVETIANSASTQSARAGAGVAPGLLRPEAEELAREIRATLTWKGLGAFVRKCLHWVADQALLLFDFTASVPGYVERGGRRRFNFWPVLLLFFSTIGFLVNFIILTISLVQRLWHGTTPSESLLATERLMLQWMVLSAVGRLAALNMGSAEVERSQAARRITRSRIAIVIRRLLLLAVLACVGGLFGLLLVRLSTTLSTTAQAGASRSAWWVAIGIGAVLFMTVGWGLVRLYARVWREVKTITQESAGSDGLRSVETWLAIIDGRNYARSWETAAARFQRAISKESWVDRIEKNRGPLGKVLSRKLISTKFKAASTHFGADFVFATSFEGLPSATETVTFTRQKPDGAWKAESYHVAPADTAFEPLDKVAPASPWITVARVAARLVGTFGMVVLLVLIFGTDSVPWRPPFGFSRPINWVWPVVLKGGTEFANPSSPVLLWCCTSAMILMLAGFIAGWWRDGLAALLMLAGWALFEIAERYAPLLSWIHLAAMTGVLFGLAWVGGRQRKLPWALVILAFPIVLGMAINFVTIQAVSATVTHTKVDRLVTAFPETADLSSPATASAAMWWAYAQMDTQTISRMSLAPLNPQQYEDWFRKEQQRDSEGLGVYLKARIITVQTWRDALASVIACIPFPPGTDRVRYDNQYFARVNGQWKFLYEERQPDLAAAKLRLELESGKRTLCSFFTADGNQAEERSAANPGQASLMKLVHDYFFFNDHLTDRNIAFRQSIEWGNSRTNLDGSRSIRYRYRAELWKGPAVTNDQVFTCDQNRVVSVKDYAPEGLPTYPERADKSLPTQPVPPVVIQTIPESGASDVDPALLELRVTFSKPMQPDGYGWTFVSGMPETRSGTHHWADERTSVLPVKLEPGKLYAIWINKEDHQAFMDQNGQPAVPYLLIFQTKTN